MPHLDVKRMLIDNLQPAPVQQVKMYEPYFPQTSKRMYLSQAISLHQEGALEGQRSIEGGNSIDFIVTWNVASLPSDLCRCRIQFNGDADLTYEMTLANFEFIDFLIDVIRNYRPDRPVDFSRLFYRRLLHLD